MTYLTSLRPRSILPYIAAVLSITGAAPALAAPIFIDDGSTLVIDTVLADSDPYQVGNGRIVLESPGSLTIGFGASNAVPAITTSGGTASFEGRGGSITGLNGLGGPGFAALRVQADSLGEISGGIYRGGDGNIGGTAAEVANNGLLSMTGGELHGGAGNVGGAGIDVIGATAELRGGQVLAGTDLADNNGADAVQVQGLGTVIVDGAEIRGSDARFSGGDAIAAITGSRVEVHSGQLIGGAKTESGGLLGPGRALFMSGGEVSVTGGEFTGEVLLQSGVVGEILGGVFNDALVLNLGSEIDLSGGTFLSDFTVVGGSVLNVFGSGLDFAGGRLTGLLSDGGLIDVGVNLGAGNDGEVRLFETPVVSVPEPGGAWLFALGVAALILAATFRAPERVPCKIKFTA